MLKWLLGFLAGAWFVLPSREEVERVTKEQLREFVARECEKITPGCFRQNVQRAIDSKVERYMAGRLDRDVQQAIRARVQDALCAIDLRPRVEAAARQAIEDALKRADFCGAHLEEAARRTIEAALAKAEVTVDSLESYVFRALGRIIREKMRGRNGQ